MFVKVPTFRLNLQPSSGESEKKNNLQKARFYSMQIRTSKVLSLKAKFRNSCCRCMLSSRFSGFLQLFISHASRMRRLRQLALARKILEASQETVWPKRKQCSAKANFCDCLCSTAFWWKICVLSPI